MIGGTVAPSAGASCGSDERFVASDAGKDGPARDVGSDALAESGIVRDQSCGRSVAMSCGQAAESCCTSLVVPGGEFEFAVSSDGFGIAGYPASVSTFSLEKYEITVERFRSFVEHFDDWRPMFGDGAHPRVAGSGWQGTWPLAATATELRRDLGMCTGTWTEAPGANEVKPISCVTWFEVFAFCAWDGGRMPTMVERVFAGSAGPEYRQYPWGASAVDAGVEDGRAVFSPEAGVQRAAPENVGTVADGAGKWGHLDLAGNVDEWILDRYPPTPFPNAGQGGCRDCALIGSGDDRMQAGGSFDSPELFLNTRFVRRGPPGTRSPRVGGRCVK